MPPLSLRFFLTFVSKLLLGYYVIIFGSFVVSTTFLFLVYYHTFPQSQSTIPVFFHLKDWQNKDKNDMMVWESMTTLKDPKQSMFNYDTEVLKSGNPYTLTLELLVPPHFGPNNKLQILTVKYSAIQKNATLCQSVRSINVPRVRYMQSVLHLLFHLHKVFFGTYEEVLTISVKLQDRKSFLTDENHDIFASIVLISTGTFGLYRSSLIIESDLVGFRYLITKNPFTMALIGLAVCGCFSSVLIMMFTYYYIKTIYANLKSNIQGFSQTINSALNEIKNPKRFINHVMKGAEDPSQILDQGQSGDNTSPLRRRFSRIVIDETGESGESISKKD